NYANPRFRALSGTQIYDTTANTTAGAALVTATAQQDPHPTMAWEDFQISLLDDNAGSDYIAGGAGNDQIFGQLGNDVIQGDGSIDIALVGASRDASNALVLFPSFEAATDGDDYIEGNGGNDVIFGNLGQDDILGGNSTL